MLNISVIKSARHYYPYVMYCYEMLSLRYGLWISKGKTIWYCYNVPNCDSQIFLGGSEQTTLKDLNTILGKETIDMYNIGESRGQAASYNMNYQKLGYDLMSIDELVVMDGSKCIVQVRGVRPFLSDKYDLTQHPNYKYTADANKNNLFKIEDWDRRELCKKESPGDQRWAEPEGAEGQDIGGKV